MSLFLRHIIGILLVLFSVTMATGQNVRFVQYNSTHALSVPDNDAYSFQWSMTCGPDNIPITSTSNVTNNIHFNQRNAVYNVSVYPVLDSVDCWGEPIYMTIYTVDYLSLHAFDDVFYVLKDDTLNADVSLNDFDDMGHQLIYNPTLIVLPQNGTADMTAWGEFQYIPNPGFVGRDSFIYEVRNDANPSMYAYAWAYIVVQERTTIADLYIEKTGPAKALYNSDINYTIVVRNNGPDVARNVIVRDSIPFGLFNTQYAMLGLPLKPWTGYVQLGNLNSGDSVVISLKAFISPNAPRFIYNQTLTYSNTFDPDYSDNDSIWMTELFPLFVDLPDQLRVPSCRSVVMPSFSEGSNEIVSYRWNPRVGLNDSTLANPTFTPDETTIGRTIPFILQVVDRLGNIASDTVNVIISEMPIAAIESDTLYRDLDETLTISASESSGDMIDYFWWADPGRILGSQLTNQIIVDTLGLYYLNISDRFDCEALDSVTVLLRSHPPVAIDDYVEIMAGTDSTVNVLTNDYDLNRFDIRVTEIVTPPHRADYTFDEDGNINFAPHIDSWAFVFDSLEYRVCNNGIPEQCNTAWLKVKVIRPPLNADIVIGKGANAIAFWGDTLTYHLLLYNNGPDTARTITVTDKIDFNYLAAPTYRISYDNGDSWTAWQYWTERIDINTPLIPGTGMFRIDIKAYIEPTRRAQGVFITNTARHAHDIIENDALSDTATVVTKIKDKVIARAGDDRVIGVCQDNIELDGSTSGGENLTYLWEPTRYFINPTSPTPTFVPQETGLITIVLTITDDDDIRSTDTLKIDVLPPPLADAGPTMFLAMGENVILNGSGSSGSGLTYQWTTLNGHFQSNPNARSVVADSLGTYILTVTDKAGCTDTDTVEVYRYYYPPFAIPDYYSTTINTPLVRGISDEHLLYNDYEPNGVFTLSVIPANNMLTTEGGRVTINANGTFTYTPRAGFIGVDAFTYEVCNSAFPPRCSRGYAQITVNNISRIVNLTIDKEAKNPTALIGRPDGIEFSIRITNTSSESLTDVVVTDSLQFITNARYSFDGANFPMSQVWTGAIGGLTLAPGQSRTIYIRGTVTSDAPGRLFNAATVTNRLFDDLFSWDDVANRNVDTVSVEIQSGLWADARLIERNMSDNNRNDHIIGFCDRLSVLSGATSQSLTPSEDIYQWSPAEFLTNPYSVETTFLPVANDTTITFELLLISGARSSRASVTVTISPEMIADAGPDRKMNEGEALVIDATQSQGYQAVYEWYYGASRYTTFENGNVLKPIVTQTGIYVLIGRDFHGCTAIDSVVVRENQLFALNDILVVIRNYTVTANVSTNDYDPNGDSIYYPGTVGVGPFNGQLLGNPKISPTGEYTYKPNDGFIGDDYFTVRVCDDNNPDLCKYTKVFIRVIDVDEVNSQPVANHDVFFVNQNSELTGNVLANDFDFDGGTVTLITSPVITPRKGSVSLSPEGTFVYTPSLNAEGADSFQYRIIDNGVPAKYDSAWVSIYIHKLPTDNHYPVAVDDAYYVVGKPITGNLLLNDYDPDGNDFFFDQFAVVRPLNGEIVFTDQYGGFQYTPNAGYEGTDIMTYQIKERNTIDGFETQASVYFINLSPSRYKTDVAITKTAPDAILSGEVITWSLTVKINGPTLANDIVVRDTINSMLTNRQFSIDGGVTWQTWTSNNTAISQMMLYEEREVLVRASIPEIYSGNLMNRGWVNHGMTETNPANNNSTSNTEVYQRVIAHAGNDTLIGACITDYMLDGSASIGSGTLQYRWTPAARLSNATIVNPLYSTIPDLVQRFELIVSSNAGGLANSDTAEVWIEVAEAPVAVAGPDQWPLTPDPVFLDGTNSTGAGPLRYEWWYTDRNGVVTQLSLNDTVWVSRSGSYQLTVTDIFGCNNTDLMHVGYPIDEFIAVDDYIETPQQESVKIYVLRNDIIDNDDEYNLGLMVNTDPKHGQVTWNPSDSTFLYIPDEYFVGYDTFTYIISTRYGSSDEAMVIINVLDRPAVVPDGFSPNGDGINDYLIIQNIEKYPLNKIVVFNRWGNIVYQKEGYSNSEPWDGVANKGIRLGRGPLPAAIYLYILDLGDDKVKQRIVKGNVYIATDNRN